MGSSTLYQLAKNKKYVLGIEQSNIPNSIGSSHGINRIIRLAYSEHPAYVPLLKRAYELWYDLEKASNEKIESDGTVNRADGEYLKNPQNFNWVQGVGLLILACIYSISLRELGFIFCTSLFLFLGGYLLGDRRYIILIPISISSSVIFWYLVEKVLTIYLRPWPNWIF